jgi:hypothetical protein
MYSIALKAVATRLFRGGGGVAAGLGRAMSFRAIEP